MALPLFDNDQTFCTNPECRLNVHAGDPGVTGYGNWAEIDGVLVGRGRFGGTMLCDLCGRASIRDADEPLPQVQLP